MSFRIRLGGGFSTGSSGLRWSGGGMSAGKSGFGINTKGGSLWFPGRSGRSRSRKSTTNTVSTEDQGIALGLLVLFFVAGFLYQNPAALLGIIAFVAVSVLFYLLVKHFAWAVALFGWVFLIGFSLYLLVTVGL